MTGLTVKQRTKVNAALCIIHDSGLDANAVTQLAQTIMATGHDPRTAYERALNQFADSNPQVGQAIGKVAQLVEASCPRTVAQYDTALSQYIDSGDDSALTALAPMIAEDSVALAVSNGELAPEAAATATAAQALGLEDAAPAAPAEAPAATPTANTFAFVGLTTRPAAPDTTASQVSPVAGTGTMAPKAQRHWSDAPYVGPLSAGKPPANNGTFASAKEAARAAASRSGVATLDTPDAGA